MKGKKYKRSETFMRKIYEKHFGFRPAYQILVDAQFCRELLKCKIVAKDVLPTVFGGPIKILASCCVLDELRRLDDETADGVTGSVFIAKRFEMRTCRHSPSMTAVECITDLVGPANQHHYVVAVQNYDLRKKLRDILGTPLAFINRGVVLMEDPSKATLKAAHDKELSKLRPQDFELKALRKAAEKPKEKLEEDAESKKKKKKKPAKKQPNPLSVKKPKGLKAESAEEPAAKPKRKRRPKKPASSTTQTPA